ncbi:triose-phosphate isomerase [Cytophagales bacterium LB-30]|uniref:Triosephosphate isomerase n=1 Tax=Shiella aurantiaca TaxID=3058365 RepID=A0ABT8F5U9_9BACT|nr:triose-phosphate isomerase [Shiella aurantiaca]MDN4165678.1 triose-phosphate isomerase [Shiella aurantiaca]
MRKKIVAGNWKMNGTYEDGLKLASEVIHMVQDEVNSDVEVVLCTPFIHLSSVGKLTKEVPNVHLGAQNCSEYTSGAYTGEVSVQMLRSVHAEYVIIGHSERREYFNETNQQLAKKVAMALSAGLTPIFCCGEPLQVREAEQQYPYVTQQITESLFDLSEDDMKKVVIAYEPIWAIGTGRTASSQQAQEMHKVLRQHIANRYSEALAAEISILYGGSAKPDNAEELFACPDVDGGLIGGASLKSRDFLQVVKACK